MKIELTLVEAREVACKVVSTNSSVSFDDLPEPLQKQMTLGVIGTVDALEALGYLINRPLKSVEGGKSS